MHYFADFVPQKRFIRNKQHNPQEIQKMSLNRQQFVDVGEVVRGPEIGLYFPNGILFPFHTQTDSLQTKLKIHIVNALGEVNAFLTIRNMVEENRLREPVGNT